MLRVLIRVFAVFAFVGAVPIDLMADGPVIETDTGSVQGSLVSSGVFLDYYSYKGIPYAEPPLGDLRFRAPVPHRGWEGVLNASEHGNICLQPSGGDFIGDEDCLFLNVYTPNLIGRRAVMVWIHGGAFSAGGSDTFLFGPEFLVSQDVLLVSFNYRLGILGFMSTGDRHSPGNYGMKDMVVALDWIQRNILNFGGDPDNITIFGESAGSAAVHYLMLSRMSKGLFHRAIAQSGSVLNTWAFATETLRWTSEVAGRLGIIWSDTEDLVDRLRNVSAQNLIEHSPTDYDYDIPRGWSQIPFTPTIDAPDSEEPIFLHAHPRVIIESGDFASVDFMIGYLDWESQFMITENIMDPNTFPTINANPTSLVPTFWNVSDEDAPAAADEIWQYYFDGQELDNDLSLNWTLLVTDHNFIVEVDETVRLHARLSPNPVFHYVFTFVGDLNIVKQTFGLMEFPGAVHSDDNYYLFSFLGIPEIDEATNPAALTRRRMVKLWTNFAKYGNPTEVQDADINVIWPPVDPAGSNQEYLEIGNDLVPGIHPTSERIAFWVDLRSRYATVQ